MCRVKSFGFKTKEEEGKEQLGEQKMREVGSQRRGEGAGCSPCSPRGVRELLRAKTAEKSHRRSHWHEQVVFPQLHTSVTI